MQLEAQKWYKRRDGGKVFCIGPDPGGVWVVYDKGSLFHHHSDGKSVANAPNWPADLIEEWREPKKVIYLYRYRAPHQSESFVSSDRAVPGYVPIGSAIVEEGKFADDDLNKL